MSEALTFQLVKNKILDIEAYEVWAYSIEIILLNGSILLGCLLISFMLGEMTHMLSFVLFFIPLRMLVGGYHCRKSETCFFCTLLVYGASTLSIQLYETEIMEEAIWILAVISILIILIWSPLVNPNHLLEDYQIRRNKNIIYVMVVIDVALYGIFCKTNIAMAHSEMMFIILVALTLLAGVMKNKRIKKQWAFYERNETMLRKSISMQISYMLRRKSTVFVLLVLLITISINFFINMKTNGGKLYVSQMYSFEKMLTLSDNTMVGYFMMQYYPLLVVIPTACVYISERNSGIDTYIQSRVGKRNYWYGKLLAVFVVIFFVFSFPYIIELICSVFSFSMKSSGDMLGDTYWEIMEQESQYFLSGILLKNRVLYATLMIFIFGMISAILAVFNLAVTTLPIFKSKILTYLPIYILFMGISMLNKFVKLKFTVDYHFILRMFEKSTEKNYPIYLIFLMSLIIVSVILIEIKVKREEII